MENKTGKPARTAQTGRYFKYAIGEIVLVIVGILIALQINTWNENRVAQARIESRLVNLVQEIELDVIEMEGIQEKAKRRVIVITAILQGAGRAGSFAVVESDFPAFRSEDFANPNDDLSYLKTMDGHSSTYDGLVSSGEFYLIENQKLANSIQNYYARIDEIKDAERWNNQETWLVVAESKRRLGLGTFSYEGTLERLIEMAATDKQFGAELEQAYVLDMSQYIDSEDIKEQALQLMQAIESYCNHESEK